MDEAINEKAVQSKSKFCSALRAPVPFNAVLCGWRSRGRSVREKPHHGLLLYLLLVL